MITVKLTKQQIDLLEKAVRYTISDLQYEQHQAYLHGCSGGRYKEEIQEYKQLKETIYGLQKCTTAFIAPQVCAS